MGKQETIGILALAAAAVWAMSRGKETKEDTGNGGEIVTGPVTVTGGIVRVEANRGAVMGAHLKPKEFGTNILVTVPFNVNALRGGVPVPWNYRLECRLGHSTQFGWKRPSELGFQDTGYRELVLAGQANGLATAYFTFVAPEDPDQVWDVHAKLLAAESDTSGNPLTSYKPLGGNCPPGSGEVCHDGAIRTIAGSATTSGNITDIMVSQAGAVQPRGRWRLLDHWNEAEVGLQSELSATVLRKPWAAVGMGLRQNRLESPAMGQVLQDWNLVPQGPQPRSLSRAVMVAQVRQSDHVLGRGRYTNSNIQIRPMAFGREGYLNRPGGTLSPLVFGVPLGESSPPKRCRCTLASFRKGH